MTIVDKLKNLLPELEYGRGTHVEWRDCDQRYRDENPSIGDKEFHNKLVKIYDNRISTVKEAIEILEKWELNK